MEKFQYDTKTESELPFKVGLLVGLVAQPRDDKSLISKCSFIHANYLHE